MTRRTVNPRALEIMSAFPELFSSGPRSLEQTLMNRGFKCGEGWFPLIKGFLGRAQLIGREDGLSLRVREVKQVHGHLQIHVSGANERLWEVMRYTHHISGFICETCGGPSQAVKRGGQLTTRCPACLLRPDTPASWREEPAIPIIGEPDVARTSESRTANRRKLATVGGLLAKLQKLEPGLPVVVEGQGLGPDRTIECLELLRPPMLRGPRGRFLGRSKVFRYGEEQTVRILTVRDQRI